MLANVELNRYPEPQPHALVERMAQLYDVPASRCLVPFTAFSEPSRDAEGRPVRFEQAGWTVRYLEWRPGPPGAPDLPVRIDAESGDARVRLVIDDWIFASP